jgi:hypothetical protein
MEAFCRNRNGRVARAEPLRWRITGDGGAVNAVLVERTSLVCAQREALGHRNGAHDQLLAGWGSDRLLSLSIGQILFRDNIRGFAEGHAALMKDSSYKPIIIYALADFTTVITVVLQKSNLK